MRKIFSGKKICNWLGVLAIVVQAFMPVWQAYAAVDESPEVPSAVAEICYALTEAAGETPGNLNHPFIAFCVNCRLSAMLWRMLIRFSSGRITS